MTSHCRGVVVARTLFVIQAAQLAALLAVFRTGQAQEPPATQAPIPRQIVVRLSGDLLLPLIEKPIDEVLPVEEDILGVLAVGNAHVTGQPQLVFRDDPQAAAFTVTLSGTIQSRTVGRKGPVQIHSRSVTQFTAAKRVAFQPGRGFVGEPATIAARTNSQTERIQPDRRGLIGRAIERRAWARVGQSRQQVNAIVRAKAEVRIREAFDRLLEERLARVNRMADQRYALAAVLGGPGTPRYACSTKHGCLLIAASSGKSPGVSQDPLELPARDYPGSLVQVWVHEGVIGERAALVVRQADWLRRTLTAAMLKLQRAEDTSPQNRTNASYDFATCGEWIVVEGGRRAAADSSVTSSTSSAPSSTTEQAIAADGLAVAGQGP